MLALKLDGLPPTISRLSRRVLMVAGVRQGVFILNIQRYRSGRTSIPPHFDGEYFDWGHDSSGSIIVRRGLRPKTSALLCLVNYAPDSATTLIEEAGGRHSISLRGGDLLLFDNFRQMHCVEPFDAAPCETRPWVRYMVGWRSITEGCLEVREGEMLPVTSSTAEFILSSEVRRKWANAPF
jgi:hypothetical protein